VFRALKLTAAVWIEGQQKRPAGPLLQQQRSSVHGHTLYTYRSNNNNNNNNTTIYNL